MIRAHFHRPSIKFILSCLILLQASVAQAAIDACSAGVGVPPFLAGGVPPNVLMMIDNSASMYDPAYDDTGDPGYCNDDSFTAATAYGGYFDPSTRYYYDANKFKSPAPANHCTAAVGTVYSNADVCITINSAGTPAVFTVTAFAASGNFLNWAMTSKFDIEKGILTGGKYDAANQRLVPESRGCQGRRMVKQLSVTNLSTNTASVLTMGVWPGSLATDHLTRIEIFNTSTTGLRIDSAACKAAIEATSLGQVTNLAGSCLMIGKQNESFANSNGAFNQSFQTCWGYPTVNNGDITRIYQDCEKVYLAGTKPTAITESDSGYVCMGNSATGSGYVGRCVTATGGSPAINQTCTDIACAPNGHPYLLNYNQQCTLGLLEECVSGSSWRAAFTTGGSCSPGTTYQSAQTLYNCPSGYALSADNSQCTKPNATTVASTTNTIVAGCYKNNGTFDSQPTATVAHPAGCYSGDVQTYWIKKQNCVATSPAVPPTLTWVAGAQAAGGCIEKALRDYCSGFYDPDVIDTSSPVTSVADDHFPNLPAILVTMATNAQLGKPIATMDGYIEKATAPQGLLQEFSSDLRMGAMRFNKEGTNYECNQANPDRLYNCTADNKDGGRVISYIESNNSTELVSAINNIVANAWTPMAEAMFDAIGYYTQKDTLRLDSYDFFTGGTASYAAGKSYGAGSIVWSVDKWWRTDLGGTTVGATPELDAAAGGISDWHEMNIPAWADDTNYSGGAIVSSGGVLYQSISGGTSDGTSLTDDTGVIWTPYYDPVVAHCQSNNILLITDGAPTADQATAMTSFATAAPVSSTDLPDPDGDGWPGCGKYWGSTYLDDLAKYAAGSTLQYTKDDFVDSEGTIQKKKPINTYVVAAGTLKDDGTDSQCNPPTLLTATAVNGGTEKLYTGEDPTVLSTSLRDIFNKIRAGAAAGSAASVISASRGGEGAIYQAIFWPSIDDGKDPGGTVDWLGEVHSLFIDEEGSMFEDTDRNRAMDVSSDQKVVLFYDDSGVSPRTKACIGGQVAAGVCLAPGTTKEVNDVKYLWSANDWLARISNANILTNRSTGSYISADMQRYIFTWNDLNNDGITDPGEVLPFVDRSQLGFTWNWDSAAAVSANRDLAYKDFNAANAAEANTIINWVRGLDGIVGLRQREVPGLLDLSTPPDGVKEASGVWRLGDVIYSTPVTVSKPTEAYHFLYRDFTYATFADRHKDRRHMIYFGANDGMLHAANGGFYNFDAKKFCLAEDCTQEAGKPELGAELWGYVPYNLLPHLKCLTDTGYKDKHKYFVDLRPRIFDVKIFPEEADCAASKTASGCIHPNGWGTILVGGMRFGGTPMSAKDDLGSVVAADTRIFTSSYFILDITNPEAPPILLGELTRTSDAAPNDQVDLGYSTVISTMVPMNVLNKTTPASSTYSWNLILGSGPTSLDGRSTQPPKIAVLPLDWLTSTPKIPLRIPNSVPSGVQPGGSYTLGTATGLLSTTTGLPTTYNGFVSDMITADYDLNNFMADAVYFGTVDCRANCSDPHPNWGGTLYRLVTREMTAGVQSPADPSEWSGLLSLSGLTNPLPLIDVAQPITAAPAVATDSSNYWVYFGTGRFFDAPIDKTDASQQSFYGIKEPQDCNRDFTWATVTNDAPSELKLGSVLTHNGTPGSQGILQMDQILVQSGSATSAISCIPSAVDANWGAYFNQASNDICNALVVTRTTPINTFTALRDYITGTPGTCSAGQTIANKPTGTDGWFRNFSNARERNLGQAAILGGLTSFTTYQPYNDICQSEGVGYLYSLYYQTGTAYFKPTLGLSAVSNEEPANVLFRTRLGRGLATTPNLHVGTKGAKAFVQTSTGEIKEVEATNPPTPIKSGRSSWKDVR